jgi:hypothetical protein
MSDYAALLRSRNVLAPIDHPEPARFLITGTGLTHIGSADADPFMLHLYAALAEKERRLISERTRTAPSQKSAPASGPSR